MKNKNKGSSARKEAAVIIINDEEEFEHGDAGASSTYPEQCSSLRKGGHVLLKNRPCKIVEMSTSAPGKHGHAKVHLIGLDLFTGKKYEDICPAHHNMDVPNVKRLEYQIVSISRDGYLTIMDDKGQLRSDIKVEEDDLGKEIKVKFEKEEDFMVSVISAMDEEKVIAMKAIKQP
ncbi:eukaryotic translation initiation factor 5A-1-like [Mytilus californianus]|uniref:eukaryotic translation initiation factor 5A-1-like n=1 Tax=Mytilus californianus TaxID=6549 RepID=UPI0022456D35|nr:eukaryotic translation initiation factor 5A-1-like [Mytilus californianus]